MNNTLNYSKIVAVFSILAGVLSLGCLVTGAFAVDFNFDAFSAPVLALRYSSRHQLSRWFLLLDMFGYYLLLLPVLFYLHRQYKYSSPWTSLFTFCGAAYILIGAIGAAILAAVWPELMKDYLLASGGEKESILKIFSIVTQMVATGMWNILETFLAAVWWTGMGILLFKERKWLGVFTILTGLSSLIDSAGNIMEYKLLAEAGLNAYLIFSIVWPVWMGIYVMYSARNSMKAIPAEPIKTFKAITV